MTKPINAPFLRTSWDFPDDNPQVLAVQVSRAYIAIANNMNARTLGNFPQNVPTENGETWFVNGKKYQGLRQVYTFTAVGSTAHGINTSTLVYFTNCFGSYTDGTNWYGLIFGSSTAINGQNSFYISPTNVVIQAGAGAPAITSGIVCLEWISQL